MSQTTNVLFEIPKAIERGMKAGEYVRNGGVIRRIDGGQIVAHLREVGQSAVSSGNPYLAGAQVALAALNLGATIAYGELTRIKLGLISKQIEDLAWAVDSGFSATLQAFERLEHLRRSDILVHAKI